MHALDNVKLGRTREAPAHRRISSFVSLRGLHAAVCVPGCLAPFATMREMASHQPLLLRFTSSSRTIVATLSSCLAYVLLLAGTVHPLDPNKRVTQYIHTAWRTQDGSLPAGMYHIAQTSDGFLWFLSLPADIYRFDGIRFLTWSLPAGAPIDRSLNIFADHAGGLWVLGPGDIVRLKGAAVSSHFQLEGGMFQSVTEAPDGSLWVLRGNTDAPLCRVTDSLKCFGKADGIPISDIQSVLADGNGGFWLGGREVLSTGMPALRRNTT
jgi:hypothetical protein